MSLGSVSISAAVDGTNSFVTVTVSCTGLTSGTVWRVSPYGDTIVRDGYNVAGTDTFNVIDYDAPQNTTVQYRCTVTDGTSTKGGGPVSATGQVDFGSDAVYALEIPPAPLLLNVEKFPELKTSTEREVVWVVGRKDPVVVSDVRKFPSGTLSLITLTLDERADLLSLLDDGRVIVFSPRYPEYGFDDTWFLSVGDVVERRVTNIAGQPERVFDLEVQRVNAPLTAPGGS